MVGISITPAPSASRRVRSAPAWPLERVTTMRWPNSGSRSYQLSFSRRRTTSPTMMVAGGFMPRSSTIPGSVASVPVSVCWSGRVPQRTAMAGVSRSRPRAINSRAISPKVVRPMKITSVSDMPTRSQSIAPTAWPVTKVTAEVCWRCVRGTPV